MAIDCSGCNAACCRVARCIHLDRSNNTCMIYLDRPDVCNTDIMFNRVWSPIMSRSEYERQNAVACDQLRKRIAMQEE